MIKTVLLVLFLMLRCFETGFIPVSYQDYPNREVALRLAIQEIDKVSKYYEVTIPENALGMENFTIHFLGLDGIWMRWSLDFHYYEQKTDLYYSGNVLVELPPETSDTDPVCTPRLYVETITEEKKSLLKLTESEQLFSNKNMDAWNYKERADFYKQYGKICDFHVSNIFVSDYSESKPIYPGNNDLSFCEALAKTIKYYYTDYLKDTLFNQGFICKKHGLLCRNLCGTIIGSGFYECVTGERFWIIRFFKIMNVGGQNELQELHAFRIENGEVYPSI